jgi:NTP pyrophosphatase (non-canonical NTP hydrolase)
VSETATYFDCGGGDITYPLLGLVGELGELVNSIVKYYRKADLITLKIQDLPCDLRKKLKDESYDALHFLMFLLIEQGLSLEEIISYGREKLEKRMEDGTIHKENRVSDSIVGKRISIGEERSEVGIVTAESTDVVTVITPFVNVVLHLAEIGVSQANLKIEVIGTASQEELDRIDGVDHMDKGLYTVACPRENFYKALK